MGKSSKEFDTMTDYALGLVGAKIGAKISGMKTGSGGLVAAAAGSKAFKDKFVKKAKGGKVK
jgi:hypothetical protein